MYISIQVYIVLTLPFKLLSINNLNSPPSLLQLSISLSHFHFSSLLQHFTTFSFLLSRQPSVIFIPYIYTMSTVSGLRRMIRRFLEHKIDAQDLARVLEAPTTKPSPLAVTSLSLPDIQKILGLTLVMDDEFDYVAPVPVPQDLSMLARWMVQRNQLISARTLVGKVRPRSWRQPRKRSQYPLQAEPPPCQRSRSGVVVFKQIRETLEHSDGTYMGV